MNAPASDPPPRPDPAPRPLPIRRVALLVCRALAVVMILLFDLPTHAATLWQALSAFSQSPPGMGNFLYLIAVLIPWLQVALAVWIWRHAGIASAWILGTDLQDDPLEPDLDETVTADRLQAIAFMCLGLWTLITTVTDLGQVLAFAMLGSDQSYDRMIALALLAAVVKLALGFWLVFGAPGLERTIARVRSGTPA